MSKPANSRFLFPTDTSSTQNPVEKSSEGNVKSDLELKRELLRKKKEELEKKFEKKAVNEPQQEEIKTQDFISCKTATLTNSELLKLKREELEKKKKATLASTEQQPQTQPENTSKLEELRKKYQHKEDPAKEPTKESQPIEISIKKAPDRLAELKQKYQKPAENTENKPSDNSSNSNRLEELRKKYQKNSTEQQQTLGVPLRTSEPVRMGKSVSTSHATCLNKNFKFPPVNTNPSEENKHEEEEKSNPVEINTKDDFLKKLEQLQQGLDHKINKMKTEEVPIVTLTRSVDLGQPQKISINSYKAGLKKNLLAINPEAEKLMDIPKKILTPSGMRIHSTLAERVAGLEALFSGGGGNANTEPQNIEPELKKKLEEELRICLDLYHLTMERPELPEKRQKPKSTFRKRLSKEWI